MRSFYEMLRLINEEEYDAEKDAKAMGYRGAHDAEQNNWGLGPDPNRKPSLSEKGDMERDALYNPRTLQELKRFIDSIKEPYGPKIPLWRKDERIGLSGTELANLAKIDLKEFIKDIGEYQNFKEFWLSRDFSEYASGRYSGETVVANTFSDMRKGNPIRYGVPESLFLALDALHNEKYTRDWRSPSF